MITLKQKFLILGGIIYILLLVIILMYFIRRYLYRNTEYLGNDTPLYSLCTKYTKRCKKPAGSHSCCVDHLVTMLEALTDELGSKIFIICGTALAWKRYNGKYMIPHDDDLDTGILAEDEELLKAAIPRLEKKGFVFHLSHKNNQGSGPDPSCSDSKNCPIIKYPPCRYYYMEYSKNNKLYIDIALLITSQLKDWYNSISRWTTKVG